MKRLIVAAVLLLLFLSQIAQAAPAYTVYLPVVNSPLVYVLDCMDGNGRLMECP